MNIKQKIHMLVIGIAVFGGLLASPLVLAEGNNNCGVNTSIIKCSTSTNNKDPNTNAAWQLLQIVIKIMTGGIGVLAIAGIVYGSILYTSAGGSPDQVKKAIEVIRNVVIGILAYALMFAVLNFIIPGGVFG